MKKFMALYFVPRATLDHMMATATPEQKKAGMEGWMKWVKANEKALVDMGGPLCKTKRVTAQGASETRNEITGYTLVQAESAEAAAKLYDSSHPHLQLPGAFVELIECMPIPGR